MEESVFQQETVLKEVLAPSGILTQVKPLMRELSVNADRRLASHNLFEQENPKFHADNAPTSISEAQRV